jgi:hypothetical protein
VETIEIDTMNKIMINKNNLDGFNNPLTENIHEIMPMTTRPIGLLNE